MVVRSKILGISPEFLEDSQRMSENALLLKIVRKVFQQVTGVFLVIIMDVGEEVVQPLAHINLRQFAALWQKKYQIKLKNGEND